MKLLSIKDSVLLFLFQIVITFCPPFLSLFLSLYLSIYLSLSLFFSFFKLPSASLTSSPLSYISSSSFSSLSFSSFILLFLLHSIDRLPTFVILPPFFPALEKFLPSSVNPLVAALQTGRLAVCFPHPCANPLIGANLRLAWRGSSTSQAHTVGPGEVSRASVAGCLVRDGQEVEKG